MVDYHVVLGVVTVAMGIVAYALYLRSIFQGITKPHPFTWFLFGLVDGTVFIASTIHGGGPGAWAFGVASLINFGIFLLALWWGEKRIARIDWICLFAALVGIAAWVVTNNALYAVLLACLSDALAKIPTIRKSYVNPNEESLSIWSIDLLKYTLVLGALSSVTLTTALFPIEIVLSNAIVVAVILMRRQLAVKAQTR